MDDLLLRLENLKSAAGEFLADDLCQRQRKMIEFLKSLDQQFVQQGIGFMKGDATRHGDVRGH